MKPRVTAVFEGGGIRGIALTGAAAATLDAGLEFGQVIGTSAGAIVASLIAAGFDSSELRKTAVETDWPRLSGDSGFLKKNFSMVTRLGFHSGHRLQTVIRSNMRTKGIRTFADLPRDALKVVVTDLTHGRGMVFPDDLESIGHDRDSFSVAKAVRISASVPFLFTPVRLRDHITGEELVMADGAMAARFPVQLAPREPLSIGFRLGALDDAHNHYKIKGPVSLATAVIASGITARDALPLVCGPLDGVIEVDAPHDPLDFDVDPAQAAELFESGYRSTVGQLAALNYVA